MQISVELDTIITDLKPYYLDIELVGSRITCNPPPMNTDQDVLVHVLSRSKLTKIRAYLEGIGFIRDGKEYNDGGEFYSYKNKRQDINFILTSDQDYFYRFMAATSVAKKLNLLRKEDRVMLFEAVIRGTKYIDTNPVTITQIDYSDITKSVCGG